MVKLYAGALVTYLPERFHAWLDEIKEAGFDKKLVQMYALDELMKVEKKELVSRLAVYHLEALERGEVGH